MRAASAVMSYKQFSVGFSAAGTAAREKSNVVFGEMASPIQPKADRVVALVSVNLSSVAYLAECIATTDAPHRPATPKANHNCGNRARQLV